LIEYWCIYYANNGVASKTERDADAKHGEAVCEVYSAVERVNHPGWLAGHEVWFVWASIFGVAFFADKVVGWVLPRYLGMNEELDLWNAVRVLV
jgi:hypothetical protein